MCHQLLLMITMNNLHQITSPSVKYIIIQVKLPTSCLSKFQDEHFIKFYISLPCCRTSWPKLTLQQAVSQCWITHPRAFPELWKWGKHKWKFLATPSFSLKICHYLTLNYIDFKEIPSHHLGKKWVGGISPISPVAMSLLSTLEMFHLNLPM